MVFKKTFIEESKIRFKILDLLSRREHSFKELLDKLKDRVDSKVRLLEELNKVREENLQSDERFTESYTSSRSVKGFGPEKIAYELKSRGISETLVEKIVYSEDINWIEVLEREFNKKFISDQELNKLDLTRVKKFFLQRGFDFDQINKFLEK